MKKLRLSDWASDLICPCWPGGLDKGWFMGSILDPAPQGDPTENV